MPFSPYFQVQIVSTRRHKNGWQESFPASRHDYYKARLLLQDAFYLGFWYFCDCYIIVHTHANLNCKNTSFARFAALCIGHINLIFCF